ncbi:hypothetical protein SAMN05216304_11761 [Bosea sp. OK403]|uniref:hypothetical protein n=1 Tax=Bosea sp. OK403 TaxID=1855286 RepID=UPI0008EC462E|nr:hypothetical protein [Bosea sp. OK403]SFJ87679.1 hypothetical protein SAMN05216304_11761 [Bosea sp. OK403]
MRRANQATTDGTRGLAGWRSRACDVSDHDPRRLPGHPGIAEANAMILHAGRFSQCEIDGRGDALHYLPGGRF